MDIASAWLHSLDARRTGNGRKQLPADSLKLSPLEQPVVVDMVSILSDFSVAAPITNRIGGNAEVFGCLSNQQIVVGG